MNGRILHFFYLTLFRPWLRYIIGIKYENSTITRELNQFVIVANHNSHFDGASIMASLSREQFIITHPAAEVEYFNKSGLLYFVSKKLLNVIYISRNRTSNEPSALDLLDGLLKAGNSLVLFPEGSRSDPGEMLKFKTGAAVLLKNNPTIPFIPVHLNGLGRVLPKGSRIILPMNSIVKFGEPTYINPISSIEEITQLLRESIEKLSLPTDKNYNKFAY